MSSGRRSGRSSALWIWVAVGAVVVGVIFGLTQMTDRPAPAPDTDLAPSPVPVTTTVEAPVASVIVNGQVPAGYAEAVLANLASDADHVAITAAAAGQATPNQEKTLAALFRRFAEQTGRNGLSASQTRTAFLHAAQPDQESAPASRAFASALANGLDRVDAETATPAGR